MERTCAHASVYRIDGREILRELLLPVLKMVVPGRDHYEKEAPGTPARRTFRITDFGYVPFASSVIPFVVLSLRPFSFPLIMDDSSKSASSSSNISPHPPPTSSSITISSSTFSRNSQMNGVQLNTPASGRTNGITSLARGGPTAARMPPSLAAKLAAVRVLYSVLRLRISAYSAIATSFCNAHRWLTGAVNNSHLRPQALRPLHLECPCKLSTLHRLLLVSHHACR